MFRWRSPRSVTGRTVTRVASVLAPRGLASTSLCKDWPSIADASSVRNCLRSSRAGAGVNVLRAVAETLAHLAVSPHWARQVHMIDKKHAVTGAEFGQYRAESNGIAATLTTKDAIVAALKTNGWHR